MRLAAVTAAVALLLTAAPASFGVRAEQAPGGEVPLPPADPAGGSPIVRLATPVPTYAPELQPTPYSGMMLTPSPSHPWVIMPNYGYARYNIPGFGYGYRTSPYGDYSRYAYYRTGTGPYPALPRPFLRFENEHSHYGRGD